MLLIMLLGIVISYPAAVTALPHRDAELYAIDQCLGFDRRAYVNFVSNRPELVTAVNIIDQTMQPQLALVPAGAGSRRQAWPAAAIRAAGPRFCRTDTLT